MGNKFYKNSDEKEKVDSNEKVNTNEKEKTIIIQRINQKLLIDNITKRQLYISSDFSIEKMKIKADQLYQESIHEINSNDKYRKLKEAISYDNTNENIMKEYLTIEKKCNKTEFDKNIIIYYYHISPTTYQVITGEKKENSSIDLFKKAFDLLRNYNIKQKNQDIEEIKCIKYNVLNYFYIIKNKKPSINTNSTYTISSNQELALYELYLSLFREINLKIGHLYEIAKDQNLTLDEKLEELSDIGENDRIKEIIKKAKNEEIPLILLYESSFFSTTLVDVKDYILDIGFTIEKCLKLDNIYEDFYVFLWIILEIKYIISNQASPIYIDKIKEYKTDVTNIKDLDKDLESKMDSSLLNNINKYYKKEIEIEIKKNKNISFFDDLMLNKFIKIEFFNSNNIIRKFMKFIESFNDKISTSNTMIDALYTLYPELRLYKLFESEFTKNLFKNAIKTCYFFPFVGKSSGITLLDSCNILFFIPNKTKIREEELRKSNRRKIYIIGNLGVFIYIEFHEVLGHYLRMILSKITDYDFISPRKNSSSKKESGECIEFLLFGKRIEKFNVSQLLYLLDANNYNKSLVEFRRDFQDIELKPYVLSNELMTMLMEIGVNLKAQDFKNRTENTSLFSEKPILGDDNIDVPKFNDCVERFEYTFDESLIKLIEDFHEHFSKTKK